ncbi:MAG: response regulator [Terracidiphilus sp.]|nr:response regulator [Terracidiphilus sp.]MDR3798301.1 response regulator [Terracidiphilus sp.]
MTSILLVDDDPLQASLILSVLEQRFGDVRRVTDAAEALCLIEQQGFADNLHLVISGHHLPRMGGPPFVNELRSRAPDLPILVLGVLGETPADYAEAHVCFLAKPYTAAKMLNLAHWMVADPKAAVA